MPDLNSVLSLSGEGPAIGIGSEAIDRRGLRQLVDSTQLRLRRSGVSDSSCVILRAAPGLDLLVYSIALLRMGAQLALVDHRLSRDATVEAIPQSTHVLSTVVELPPGRAITRAATSLERRPGRGRLGDSVIVQFSSGTTAEPKLIGRTAASVSEELERYRAGGGVGTAGRRVVIASSVSHTWGFFGGFLSPLTGGAEIVLPESTSARGLVRSVSEGNTPATVVGVPLHVSMLASTKTPIPGLLTTVITAGARLSKNQAEEAASAMGGTRVGQTYGMTELGLVASDLSGDTPGSVGKIASSLSHRVQGGELEIALTRSPYIDPRYASQRFEDGWFSTRDAVEVEADGSLRVIGRVDGLISIGGKKFHAHEIEAHLSEDASISEAVVLVRDGRIDAFVSPSSSESVDAIRATQRLPEYMRPHSLHVRKVLPRGETGKLLRRWDQLWTAP